MLDLSLFSPRQGSVSLIYLNDMSSGWVFSIITLLLPHLLFLRQGEDDSIENGLFDNSFTKNQNSNHTFFHLHMYY